MSRMNPTPLQRQFDEGRLMSVLVAPIVSEKATMVGEKSQRSHLQGAAGRHQARDQGRR